MEGVKAKECEETMIDGVFYNNKCSLWKTSADMKTSSDVYYRHNFQLNFFFFFYAAEKH